MELLIGSGSSRDRRIAIEGRKYWTELVTLDNNPDHQPTVVHDLNVYPWPFADGTFLEIHGYEIVEHLGRQGDYLSFFAFFAEVYRLLRPGGFFAATCPSYKSLWAWGDPSHTRVITSGSLVFLSQEQYKIQVDDPRTRTAMSDFRFCWKDDFDAVFVHEDDEKLHFVLKAVKPSRLLSARAGALLSDLQRVRKDQSRVVLA